MKNHSSRRLSRETAFKIMYQRIKIGIATTGEAMIYQNLNLAPDHAEFSQKLVTTTWENLEQIDAVIQKKLINWKQSRLTDALNALLKISCAELLFFPQTDGKIVLNEALEICRQFIGEKAIKICNGVLDAIWKANLCPPINPNN